MERLTSLITLLACIAGGVSLYRPPVPQPAEDLAPAVPRIELDADPQPERQSSNIRMTELSLDLAWSARDTLHRAPEEVPDDCSRFVGQIVRNAGVPMRGRVSMLWKRALEYDTTHFNPNPYIGDLVFFDNTYDANNNGRWDDEKTHIAVVTDVDPDGTVHMVHWGGRKAGRQPIRMNLFDPHNTRNEAGKVINSTLRTRRPGHPRTAMYLTGQLWSGFATVREGQDWVSLASWEQG